MLVEVPTPMLGYTSSFPRMQQCIIVTIVPVTSRAPERHGWGKTLFAHRTPQQVSGIRSRWWFQNTLALLTQANLTTSGIYRVPNENMYCCCRGAAVVILRQPHCPSVPPSYHKLERFSVTTVSMRGVRGLRASAAWSHVHINRYITD